MEQPQAAEGAGTGSPPLSTDRRRLLALAAASVGAARFPGAAVAAHAVPRCGLDVAAENALTGMADWRVTRTGAAGDIEGFASRVSVLPGEPVDLHVSTTATSYTISAFRMGWYGGTRGRLVWRSSPLPGAVQPRAVTDAETRMTHADWQPSARLDTATWPEGCYLLRLETGDGRAQRYVPLTIRSASTTGRLVIVNSVATWQAYNRWGGADLYKGTTGKKASRSLTVSFDRPYAGGRGSGQFLVYEAPLVALAERMGLALAYTTGLDIARDPQLLLGAAAVLSLGHDEYWSPEQRLHVAKARDTGTNLAVLGANCCYRRIRYEPSPLGSHRIVVCYKEDYARDPGYRRGLPPTNDFRRSPAADAESKLLGVIYDGYPVDAPYVVTHPHHWLLAGTGARLGDSIPHLVGVEYDRVNTGHPTPRPIEILSHSPVVRKGHRGHANSAYLTLPGGAGVFATGTMRWVEALDAGGPGGTTHHGLDARAGAFTRVVTENVLRAFAQGPAGTCRPAADNVASHYPASPAAATPAP
ncbi:N,N-dimethylformamidase beta subunit family domain-containing protein [Streptomyces sp. AP-93]|uniref:N,N-dimethylformamidase beta subunit family domain-containing protein n=1 Tax=Streptomyces sp. AP-93 TaxID=2929048 RepID=UPI001FAEB27C|nr:N,N-dimethylformamidase beta subunit family domain-containing protein [Streptomyces sp. AP-93]MCJ0874968.1 hypothetical protein [Streptomyces sp. AP-93]